MRMPPKAFVRISHPWSIHSLVYSINKMVLFFPGSYALVENGTSRAGEIDNLPPLRKRREGRGK